jgi:hypothetical protein
MIKLPSMLKRSQSLILIALLLTACEAEQVQGTIGGMELSAPVLATLQIVIALVMLAGLLSLALVVVPGLTIIWLASLVYGILTGFDINSGLIFIAITVCMIVGNSLDQILMGAKAKSSGASWTGIVLSMVAAFIFSLIYPPFGGLVAALIVLFVFETLRLRNWRKAGNSTKEMAVGCATAVLARMGMGILMIGLWVLWVWLSGLWPF